MAIDSNPVGSRSLPDDCLLDPRIYTDPAIFELELDHIFSRGWLWLGVICEAQSPGQFFRNEIGGVPVIVCRAEDGKLRGFVDACGICGESIAHMQWGNGRLLQCAESHAVYDLTGTAVEGAGGSLEPIRVENYLGFLFAALKPTASLRDYLGVQADWWERLTVIRTDIEWELVTAWMTPSDTNWKEFMQPGDGYHVQSLHKIFCKYMTPKAGFYDVLQHVSPRYGHIIFPYPPPNYEYFRANLWGGVHSPEEINLPTVARNPKGWGGWVGDTFPNVIYAVRNEWLLWLQLVMPRAVDRTMVYNKVYCRRGLSDWQKRLIQREEDIWTYPMGLNGEDDWANFERQHTSLRGETLQRLVIARYYGEDPNAAEIRVAQDAEAGYRAYFRRWRRCLEQEE
ncbi:MAG: hypothetical protein IVW54_02450 [Candidatus Binataceae bacterium]|nr:hypothetical protein [Candidatus Binataceae bacterium]